jgi:hypothetical protein
MVSPQETAPSEEISLRTSAVYASARTKTIPLRDIDTAITTPKPAPGVADFYRRLTVWPAKRPQA